MPIELTYRQPLETTPCAPTKAGKHVKSNIACAHSQRYTKYSAV